MIFIFFKGVNQALGNDHAASISEHEKHRFVKTKIKQLLSWIVSLCIIQHLFPCRLAHEAVHKAHKGHESMHAQMLLILMITVLVAQVVLVEWRKRHFRSYQVC